MPDDAIQVSRKAGMRPTRRGNIRESFQSPSSNQVACRSQECCVGVVCKRTAELRPKLRASPLPAAAGLATKSPKPQADLTHSRATRPGYAHVIPNDGQDLSFLDL